MQVILLVFLILYAVGWTTWHLLRAVWHLLRLLAQGLRELHRWNSRELDKITDRHIRKLKNRARRVSRGTTNC